MEKKNEFVITIGFNRNDEDHKKVVRLLNGMSRTKAQYIVKAILAYRECCKVGNVTNVANAVEIDYDKIWEYIQQTVKEYISREDINLFINSNDKEADETASGNKNFGQMEIEEDAWGGILSSLKSFRSG